MKAEIDRRLGKTAQVKALFRGRPGVWIGADEIAKVGGFCGWRTRISDARKQFGRDGTGTIEWNSNAIQSAYRYVVTVPSVERPAEQLGMFQ